MNRFIFLFRFFFLFFFGFSEIFKLERNFYGLTSNLKTFFNLTFFKFQYLDHYDLEIEQGTFCSWHHLALVSHSVIKVNLKRYHLWDEAQILTELDGKLTKFENLRFDISGINNFSHFETFLYAWYGLVPLDLVLWKISEVVWSLHEILFWAIFRYWHWLIFG